MEVFMGLPIWQCWIILGLSLLILELFISGFLVACFGISALLTAVTVAFGASFTVQLIVFGVLNIIFLYLLRPVLQKHFMGKEVKSCVDALIGKEIKLQEDLLPNKDFAEQKINGDVWRVRAKDEMTIEAGTRVRIIELDGLTLIVEPC